ncbi:hypothetical protein JW851_00395 [Candidatus Woesearchaeota archaeon]|nr:hypothetical protein [Candidatus Woesearchaeota archaeon]
MSKKAQIRMFEMLAVLIVFLLLLSIGSIFYFRLQHSSIEREAFRAESLRSLQLFQKALFLPELDCSFVGIQKGNCFDLLKLGYFSSLLETEQLRIDYFDVFGFSKIRVKKVYPVESDWFVLYSNVPDKISSKLVSQSTVLLYNASSNLYDFGVVEVSFYGE